MDGRPVQAFGGEQLEITARPQHVDRAHLRHHVGGDELHDAIEPLLRCDRLRHDLAQPSEQDTRA
jgi:hypothetical protein